MKKRPVNYQRTLDDALADQEPLFPGEEEPVRRCRIDFCDARLREGGERCVLGHWQYELAPDGCRPVFPGAIDARGSLAAPPSEQKPLVGRRRL